MLAPGYVKVRHPLPNLDNQGGETAAERPDEGPSEPATSTLPVALGSTALTKSGREARSQIIAAFERLGIPSERWSALVGPEPVMGHQKWIPNQHDRFVPPNWDKLEQSPEEWKTLADAAWQRHRDGLLARWQSMEVKGLDQPSQLRKKRRHSSKSNQNAGFEERYEWAALRLIGKDWKEIVYEQKLPFGDGAGTVEEQLRVCEDRVRKAATELLRLAGLDPAGNKKNPA